MKAQGLPARSGYLRRPLVPVLLCLTALAGCGQQSAEPGKAPEAPARPATRVSVTKPERYTVRQAVGQPGQIEAFEQTQIYPRISGYIRKLHVDIGDEIKGPGEGQEGQLLAELSVPETVAGLEEKKALAAKAAEEIKQA